MKALLINSFLFYYDFSLFYVLKHSHKPLLHKKNPASELTEAGYA